MRFLLRGNSKKDLHRMLQSGRACLGLFAAANALGVGFVEGVPPHVYVRRINPVGVAAWKSLLPSQPGEAPDLILRKAVFARSVFKGLVRIHDEPVTDALQVWLDVASHPARGAEQANLIEHRLIHRLIGDRNGG
ncbi:MAG: RpiR family transcriptional regulator, partial [Gemmatimonadaceae bacterium]